jgi:osmotically-inducible protein OsmY
MRQGDKAMRTRLLAILLAATVGMGFGSEVVAAPAGNTPQTNSSMFSGTSTRNLGSSATNRSRAGSSSGSSSGLSGFGGMGGFGSMGSSMGTGQFGQNPWAALSSQAGRFVGANLTGLRTQSGAYNTTYGPTAYGASSYGSTGRTGARGTSRYGMSNSANQGLVSTTMVVGFQPPAANVGQVSSQLTARLEKTGRFRSAPQVLLENGVATLRGVVATDHDRVIAEQLVRLEPGVAEVRNELTLAWPSSVSAAPRPSSSVTPPSSARPPAAK